MKKIGFGLMCFGEIYYHQCAIKKMEQILEKGFHCFILTDKPEYFENEIESDYIIPLTRSYRSYYDKLILVKYILVEHDICVLIDSDVAIKRSDKFSFLSKLKDYEFQKGISYIKSLKSHPSQMEYVRDLDMAQPDWKLYKEYVEKIYPDYTDLETIWEYFMVFNKDGFNQSEFFKVYEKLQIVKEYSDLLTYKGVSGAGEGISIAIASKLSNTPIQKDEELSKIVDDNIISVSRRFTPKNLWEHVFNDTKYRIC